MVSKASDDLPEPDSPVNTISASRGISRSTFFRLCSRAPRTWMVLWPSAGGLLTILAMSRGLTPSVQRSHRRSDAAPSLDGRPAMSAATLMSSSTSGQCIPSPRATSCQLLRSPGLACSSRGYQSSGTDTVRPSLRSTVRVSSVTATPVARGVVASVAEVVIPGLKQLCRALVYEPADIANLGPPKSAAAGQPDRAEPELGDAVVPLDVNMRRLVTVARVGEEPIGPDFGDGRQRASICGLPGWSTAIELDRQCKAEPCGQAAEKCGSCAMLLAGGVQR